MSSSKGASKDAKKNSSHANLRQNFSESSPRKVVSHEGFTQKNSTSTAGSTSGSSSSTTSTFSYLKARLFGSVAGASSTFSSSARDLLQNNKKSSEQGRDDETQNQHQAGSPETGMPLTVSSPSLSSTASGSAGGLEGSSSTSSLRVNTKAFSRTLPNRKQSTPSASTLSPASGSGQPAGRQPSQSTASTIPSPLSASQSVATTQRGSSIYFSNSTSNVPGNRTSYAMSLNSAQKHLSSGSCSIIYQEGFLNKKADLQPGEAGHGWRIYRIILRSSKLYFFKPLHSDERPKFQDPRDHDLSARSQNTLPSGSSPRISITNESGMVLAAFKFESSTRTLLFEGNVRPLNQPPLLTSAPLVSKYVFGECFTELDRTTMQFKKHVCLLIFEDCLVICKRKWIRSTSSKVKDAIKFTGSSSTSAQDPADNVTGTSTALRQTSGFGSKVHGFGSRSSSKQDRSEKGYFTKWKHEAMYRLSQVDAIDLASPVPSASATFYPFAAPATATSSTLDGALLSTRTSREFDTSSTYSTTGSSAHQSMTTSTLELVVTSSIDGKEYTHRLLFLPPSSEVRHAWFSKFHRTKGRQPSKSGLDAKGSDTHLGRDSISLSRYHSNSSPVSPQPDSESVHSIDRSRLFNETTLHPDLTVVRSGDEDQSEVIGGSINGLIHELVFNNVCDAGTHLTQVLATTFPLFTTTRNVLLELRRCLSLKDEEVNDLQRPAEDITRDRETGERVQLVIQELLHIYSNHRDKSATLNEIEKFVKDILRDRFHSSKADEILGTIETRRMEKDIDAAITTLIKPSDSSTSPSGPMADLSNVLITGLTPALFLKLEPHQFAEQLLYYHAQQLNLSGGITGLLSNPAFFLRKYPTSGAQENIQSPLVFSMFSPHFLTVLITHHVLIATQSNQSTSRRPMLLAHWIRTGLACRNVGDMVGFISIAIGICSSGIVRLHETWKAVPEELRAEVALNWVPLLVKLDMVPEDVQDLAEAYEPRQTTMPNLLLSTGLDSNAAPISVPCACSIKQAIDVLDRTLPSFIQATPSPVLNFVKLAKIQELLTQARESCERQPKSTSICLGASPVAHLQQYFGHLASISQSLHDQYHASELLSDAFESSLACEPHFNGQYLDYHYKNRKMTSSYIPLLFAEAISTIRLFHPQTILVMENTGNASRKSSMDAMSEPYAFQGNLEPFGKHLQHPSASSEWLDSSATTHLGSSNAGLAKAVAFPKSRKRTYSFPPARAIPGDGNNNNNNSHIVGGKGSNNRMVNMINPGLDSLAREWLLNHPTTELDNPIQHAMQSLTGLHQTMLYVEGGELILKVKDESLESLTDRFTVEDDSAILEPPALFRTAEFNRGTSNRSSISVISGSRVVSVKAGTLEMLVYVLVMGLEDQRGKLMDEQGEIVHVTGRQLMLLDAVSYSAAFLATFRSFCSPSSLLDNLLTLFTFAHESTRRQSSGVPAGLDLFLRPNSASGETSLFNWKRILKLQLQVLKTIEKWLQTWYSDFLDDAALKAKLSEVLRQMSTQQETQKALMAEGFEESSAELQKQLGVVKRLLIQQSMRPLSTFSSSSFPSSSLLSRNSSRHSTLLTSTMEPSLDDMSVASLLQQMDATAWIYFRGVSYCDWFVMFTILEAQSADPLGWYTTNVAGNTGSGHHQQHHQTQPTSTSTSDENVVISGIYQTLQTLRRAGVAGNHWNGERLIDSFPLCLQRLCKLHHTIRAWVISQVANPKLVYARRVERIQKLLDTVVASREAMERYDMHPKATMAPAAAAAIAAGESVNMSRTNSETAGTAAPTPSSGVSSSSSTTATSSFNFSENLRRRSLPSFAETAIVSALISPECRAYSKAWMEVATSRKGTVETIESVLGEFGTELSVSSSALEQKLPVTPAVPVDSMSRSLHSNTGLVPSVGWLIERMIEACCYVRDMSYESAQLINFDKRRFVYDLVQVYVQAQKLPNLSPNSSSPTNAAEATIIGPLSSWLEMLSAPIERLDMKEIRDAATTENSTLRRGSQGHLSTGHGHGSGRSKTAKIFSKLVSVHQEKVKRDQKEFEKLERQIKDTQGRIQKEQTKVLEKQIKDQQSRSKARNQLLKTTLLRAVRPISLAITNGWSSATTTASNTTVHGSGHFIGSGGSTGGGDAHSYSMPSISQSALAPFQIQPRTTSLPSTGSIGGNGGGSLSAASNSLLNHSQGSVKPALVINLTNATCSIVYTYTKRDYVFKIVTEEGGQSLLQALDYDDMLRWIKLINEAAAEATEKRRTLLDMDNQLEGTPASSVVGTTSGNEHPQQPQQQITSFGQGHPQFGSPSLSSTTPPPMPESKSRNSVFGIELRHLMPGGNVPVIVEKCISEIEKRGLDEVGIYRVPGAVSSINKLRIRFNTDSSAVDLDSDEWKDINVVAGALKQFLRELPEAVTTSALYESLIAASSLEDYDERLMTLKDLIRTLPAPNYILLKRVIEHLERVTDFEETNHMYATNLAIVFGPTLLRPGGASAVSFAASMKNLGHQQSIVKNMILQYHWLFDVEDEEEEATNTAVMEESEEEERIGVEAIAEGHEEDDDEDADDDSEQYEDGQEHTRSGNDSEDETAVDTDAGAVSGADATTPTTTTGTADQKDVSIPSVAVADSQSGTRNLHTHERSTTTVTFTIEEKVDEDDTQH